MFTNEEILKKIKKIESYFKKDELLNQYDGTFKINANNLTTRKIINFQSIHVSIKFENYEDALHYTKNLVKRLNLDLGMYTFEPSVYYNLKDTTLSITFKLFQTLKNRNV